MDKYVKPGCDNTGKKLYQISPDFLLRQVAGEYVIIPVSGDSPLSNAVMVPNRTAVYLWNEFMEASTEEDVVQHALEKFDGSAEEIQDAVKQFIEESLRIQILREVN